MAFRGFSRACAGPRPADVPKLEEVFKPAAPPVIVERYDDRRPCYAHGRKALFHRWAVSAHPVLPRGVEPGDKDAHWFQYRNVTALVEYDDGTLGRVYPSNLQFADGGGFDNFKWLPPLNTDEESQDNGR